MITCLMANAQPQLVLMQIKAFNFHKKKYSRDRPMQKIPNVAACDTSSVC